MKHTTSALEQAIRRLRRIAIPPDEASKPDSHGLDVWRVLRALDHAESDLVKVVDAADRLREKLEIEKED